MTNFHSTEYNLLPHWPRHRQSWSTSGPVSTERGDRVRVQFPVPDIYFGM